MLKATGGTLNPRPFIIQVAERQSDIVFTNVGSETSPPWFESQLSRFGDLWPWASSLVPLCLSVLISKTGIIVACQHFPLELQGMLVGGEERQRRAPREAGGEFLGGCVCGGPCSRALCRKRLERAVRFGREEAVVVIAREIPWCQGLRKEWQCLWHAVGGSAN